MAHPPKKILMCSCEDTMRLDTAAVERGCRNGEISDLPPPVRRRDSIGSATPPRAEGPLIVALHAGSAAVSAMKPASVPDSIAFVNIRETAGWSKQGAPAGPKMAALLAAAAEPVPDNSLRHAVERRRDPDLWPRRARDRGRQAARRSSRRHRDDHQAAGDHAAIDERISGGQGNDPQREGPFRRLRAHHRRFCRAPSLLARCASCSMHRATARRRAAISCSISPAGLRCFPRTICATAICAPIPAIPRRCCARC